MSNRQSRFSYLLFYVSLIYTLLNNNSPMCLAVPAKVTQINGDEAVLDYGGVKRKANISMLSDVMVGDYVLVHVGYAISKLDEDEASETLKLWDEMLKASS
jgi:hydrogenase expression/formation protein HypC